MTPYVQNVQVHLVWHVRHAPFLNGSPAEHRDEIGDIVIDEEGGDDVKLIGVYSSKLAATAAIERSRTLDGFRDEPECFVTDAYTVDEDQWTSGFVSIPTRSTEM